MTDILTHVDSGVMTITIDRPERKNALTRAMYAAMADALAQAGADDAVRVVVLRGSEAIFSAGNDIGDFLGARDTTAVYRFISGAATCAKPLVGAVCGHAVGIGTTILAHFELVYAGDNALFSTPFVDLGLCPEAGSSLLLPQMLGYHRAAEALLMGEPMTAAAALQAGFVNRVLPVAEVHAFADAQARRLAAKPLGSLLETKRLMKAGQAARVAQQIAEEGASFGRMLGEPLTAAAALQAGFVNRVLPVVEVHAFADAQARRLAAKPLASLLESKRLMKAGQAALLARQIAEEGASFARMLGEPAAREALTAFREKRKPDFSKL